MPPAGKLRDRLTFQRRAADANGEPLGPWEDAFTVSADLVYLRGSEAVQEQRLQGVQPVIITVRASSDARQISNAWQALNARPPHQTFDIKSIEPSRDVGFLDVLAETKRTF